jgi:hypothetical protein
VSSDSVVFQWSGTGLEPLNIGTCYIGRLEMHNRSQDLRAWIERPTYGPSDVVVHPTTVPNKCILLEDIQPEEAVHRQCRRSAVCSKPDGHPGFCVGTQHGSKPRPAGVRNVCSLVWSQTNEEDMHPQR